MINIFIKVNFWMPLSDYNLTKTTLLVENTQNVGNFEYLPINYGEIAMFHGSLLHHYAESNRSCYTRISLDFRIGIDKYFDPNYVMKEAKGKHGWRKISL